MYFARIVSATTTIRGILNSTPNKTFVVQFFVNSAGGDEGSRFVSQTVVSTNGLGNASFAHSPLTAVAAGQNMTATATGAGNTSEFSAPRTVAL